MPIYLYSNPKTKEIVEVVQTMLQLHVYEKDGIKYERVFCNPQTNINSISNINCLSEKDFLNKTQNKKMNIGDYWDTSKELSDKREKILGKDPLKEKSIGDYEKRTKSLHPSKNNKKFTLDLKNKTIE